MGHLNLHKIKRFKSFSYAEETNTFWKTTFDEVSGYFFHEIQYSVRFSSVQQLTVQLPF